MSAVRKINLAGTTPDEPTRAPILGRLVATLQKEGFIKMDEQTDGTIVLSPTLVAVCLIVVLAVFGVVIFGASFYFGYTQGRTQTQQDQLREELNEVKQDAKTAKEFGIKNAERKAQTNTNTEEK